MSPNLEKLYSEIWALNCMLSLELFCFCCSFDMLSGPFHFFLTANVSTSTKKYLLHIWFQIFREFTGDLVGNELHNGILFEGFGKRTLNQSQE